MSPYAPFPFSDWGGIDLKPEADEANGAIDGLNYDLDRVGAVRTRDGFSILNGTPNPVAFSTGPFRWDGQNRLLLYGADTNAYVYSSTGVLLYTSAGLAGSVTAAAEFGTGTTSYLYFTQNTGGQIKRLTTTGTFSSPAGMPTAIYLAVQPNDNRLVAANVSGHPSRVQFSDPGDAETWGANNYVDLTPNDGEQISGIAAFGNSLLVFKQTKFFEFPGNSQDGSGNPVFNYRAVSARVGATYSIPQAVTVAPDGVYFAGRRGVYRTTGGLPAKVSGPLEPLFTGASTPYGTLTPPLNTLTGSPVASLTYVHDRLLYLTPDAGGTQYVLVYDPASGGWLVWQLPANVTGLATQLRADNTERLVFATTGSYLYTQSYSDTTDAGAGIAARYRSPYVSLNYIRRQRKWYPITSQEGTVRETIMDGTGAVGYSLARDWNTALPTTGGGRKGLVKLGTSYPKQGRHRYAQRGRAMSFQLETPTASDDFSSNTIANYTADAGATSNYTVTGGVLDASANFSTTNRLILTTGTFTDFGDAVLTMKHTLGTTLSGYLAGRILKRVDASNYLAAYVFDSGGTSNLYIERIVAGVPTNTFAALTRLTVSTAYWLRVRIEGNVITAEHFTANPASNVAANTATYTLTGSDATTFGSGKTGKTGIVSIPMQTAASLDDLSVVGGAWKVEDLVWHLTGVRQSGIETT